MSSFQVLDRATPIKRHYLLEASAGTGKTFAIENIVARLILDEENPPALEQILVVTFTRAAVRDLKLRIRANLAACLAMLKGVRTADQAHDYILAILERGPDAVKRAVNRLDEALFSYDRAQIQTIHSFCRRMLKEFLFEGGLGLDALKTESALPSHVSRRAIVDHLLHGIQADEKGKEKIKSAVSLCRNDINKLVKQLEDDAKGIYPILNTGDEGYGDLVRECQERLGKITSEEELLGFDGLLVAMSEATKEPSFAAKVRSRYRAAIIDEFQDTDPVQWEIFRRVFAEDTTDWGSLYLVGDPKQSIYSFRRADIYTYLNAAKALGEESYATLDTNFRSTPELIEALNALFASPHAAGLIRLPKLETALDIPPVKAGRKGMRHPFNDGLGAIHFMAAERKGFNRKEFDSDYYAPAIAAEIQRLMREESIQARQCAILVRDGAQAKIMSDGLRKSGIAVLNQRHPHLSRSRMLQPFAELLEAVLAPRRLNGLKQALGGLIFGWDCSRIQQLGDLKELEIVLLKFHHWKRLLLQESFSVFFEDLLHGKLPWQEENVAERLLSLEGGDELFEELVQLGEFLAAEQSRDHLSADALTTRLRRMEAGDEDDELSQKIRPNRDSDAVKILTLHTSKGLEFDIVFAPGVAIRTKEKGLLVPKTVQGNPYMVFAGKEDPDRLQFLNEAEAEQMRQLYVAMTRAKYRLYLPVSFAPGKGVEIAPMELLMGALGGIDSFDKLEQYRRQHLGHVSISTCLLQPSRQPEPEQSYEEVPLQEPQEPDFHFPQKRMLSYSSLSKSASKSAAVAQEKNPDDLPSNSEVGNLLHLLLEGVRFNASKEEVDRYVEAFLRESPYSRWGKQIRMLVSNAIRTALPLKSGPMPLSDVNSDRLFRETEFMFPWEQQLNLPDTTHIPGYLKGVIDLVFEHQGLYYIVDWKSNLLPSYGAEELEKAMAENHYFLQAKVYKEAWRRYVSAVDKRPFDEAFGGVFYLFLRGLDPDKGATQGVFHVC